MSSGYLFFFVPLLGEVLSPSGHLCSAHGVFFCREMFLFLRFVAQCHQAAIFIGLVRRSLTSSQFGQVGRAFCTVVIAIVQIGVVFFVESVVFVVVV